MRRTGGVNCASQLDHPLQGGHLASQGAAAAHHGPESGAEGTNEPLHLGGVDHPVPEAVRHLLGSAEAHAAGDPHAQQGPVKADATGRRDRARTRSRSTAEGSLDGQLPCGRVKTSLGGLDRVPRGSVTTRMRGQGRQEGTRRRLAHYGFNRLTFAN
jgi:hypothetical protein